ncbi:FTR1 family protein [Lichenihabitans sp. Uapishka_5]|uniref:iron uptake transporter permease EfeU n=1 Tax=Lichenihabitans sp. Uapishka_5 TaxID=3037302 RepID=UPI0029E7E6C7|nr:iron uptake transporter permease EfeU [Lichenihabitans sp. Uapishka_5]MDX7953499.1 FTR1 family protein [Lichenihabitans sp. Uapishka_5]
MLVAYLIMLREGIEAALIVGIIAGYLKQTGRSAWLPSVWLGVVLAIAICVVVGVALNYTSGEFPQKQQELFEGLVALAAVVILTSMVFWMKKAARSIKAELHHSVDAALRPGTGQGWALVGMAFLAVGREGLESVFFLLAIVQQSEGWSVPIGAFLGLLSAVAVGAAITYGGRKIDLRRFFRWTGAFIIFVASGLLASAVRAFHEAGLWNGLQDRAFDLSGILPADGILGTLLTGLLGYQDAPTVGELLAYTIFLVPALILFFSQQRPVAAPRIA